MSANPSLIPWPRSLEASAAVDDLARALYVNACRFNGEAVREWADVPMHERSGLVELAIRQLRQMQQPGGYFAIATTLARAEFATGLRPTHGKVVGAIGPKDGGAA